MCSEATQAVSVGKTVTLPTSVFLFVLIFSCSLVISTHGSCGPEEYPISGYPGGKCLLCEKCQEGQGLVPKCGTHIEYQVDKIDCKPCLHGKFNDKYDSSSCHVCHHCVVNEKVTKQCTPTSDTICSETCERGFYFSRKDGTHSCQKCSHCCLDGQDEEVAECKQQGDSESKQYCAPRPDKDCTPPFVSPSTGGKHESDTSNENKLSQTTVIVLIVVGTIIILVGVITSVTLCWCKRKRRATGDYQSDHNSAMDGPALQGTALQNVVQGASDQNQEIRSAPSLHESDVAGDVIITPSNGQHETHGDTVVDADVRLPQGDYGPKNSVQHSASRDYSQTSASADVSVHADTVNSVACQTSAIVGADSATRTSHRRDPLTRQRSKDSQRSGGDDADEGSYRRRKSSFSSVTENVKRTLSSKREESLVLNEEQGTDEVPGPIKILQDLEPSSRAKREGSKVEFVFRCVAQGRDRKLIYTWFKDEVELDNTNDGNTLLLKSITFRDFGWYKCRVHCEGNPMDVVNSSPTELDVTPRDGAKYKSLTDLQHENFETYENVGRLLRLKKHGLGGWRQVAFKYGMKHLDIKALESDPEAGIKTLEFVETATPGLTVYDFCKTLKEHNIRRLDIVKELENHFSAPGTAYV